MDRGFTRWKWIYTFWDNTRRMIYVKGIKCVSITNCISGFEYSTKKLKCNIAYRNISGINSSCRLIKHENAEATSCLGINKCIVLFCIFMTNVLSLEDIMQKNWPLCQMRETWRDKNVKKKS